MTRPELRARVEAMIDELIDMLDRIDGDADLEPETDDDLTPWSLQASDRVPPRQVSRRRAA